MDFAASAEASRRNESGVPSITAGMLDALSGHLEGGAPLLSETIGCWVQESDVAVLLGETEKAHPGCQIGSYPFFKDGRGGSNFVVRSEDEGLARSVAGTLAKKLAEEVPPPPEGKLTRIAP